MEDNFDQFKKNLENRPAPAYESRYWDRLEKGLEGNGRKPKGFAFWWWAIPVALLLGFNIVQYFEIRQSNERISSIEFHRDTVFQTQVVYHRDTIYRTIIEKEEVIRYTNKKQGTTNEFKFPSNAYDYVQYALNHNQNNNPFFNNASLNSLVKSKEINPAYPLRIGLNSRNKEIVKNPFIAVDALSSKNQQQLKITWPSLSLTDVDSEDQKKRKRLMYQLYKMRPKGLSIGLNGGWTIPVNEGLYNENGYRLGLDSYIHFAPNFRMWAAIDYMKIKFESDRMDESIGIPEIVPPDDFQFEVADVPQPSLQYSVGLQYILNANHKWKPYIGLGYAAVSMLPYEIVYEFENEITEVEWSFEEKVNNYTLIDNFLLFQVGLEHSINDKWSWHFRSAYRTNLDKEGFQAPRMFSVQGGLIYQLFDPDK